MPRARGTIFMTPSWYSLNDQEARELLLYIPRRYASLSHERFPPLLRELVPVHPAERAFPLDEIRLP